MRKGNRFLLKESQKKKKKAKINKIFIINFKFIELSNRFIIDKLRRLDVSAVRIKNNSKILNGFIFLI